MAENIYQSKICSKCNESKPLDAFGPHKQAKGGKQPRCRKCNNEIVNEYRRTDRGKSKKASWVKEYQHRPDYNDKRRKWSKRYLENNINAYLAAKCRTRLWNALDGDAKVGSSVADLGCSINELRIHIEAQWEEGMSWDNRSEWHIDHIKPLASFDLNDREQFLQAVHYTNLQPLWALVDIKKSNNCC